jgi:cytochrome c peroxidase
MQPRLAALGLGFWMLGCGPMPDADETGGQIEQSQFALEAGHSPGAGLEPAPNFAGIAASLHLSGAIDRSNPFFQQLGSNPRSCETCHSSAQGWTINSELVTKLLFSSKGLAPLFNLVDEGNRPDADVSTFNARIATFKATLAERGLTRFTRSVNPLHEFTLESVADPYGWSSVALNRFSGFRRPTPIANESKVASILWTGSPVTTILDQLVGVAVGASRLHLQRDPLVPLPPELAAAEASFMFGVIFAQTVDKRAGRLDAGGAKGGPFHLKQQPFFLGINDPSLPTFNPRVFNIFDAWAPHRQTFSSLADDGNDDLTQASNGGGGGGGNGVVAARGAIYRGQEIFNITARCSGCHNTPNVGGHSLVKFFDIGTADPPNCSPVLPLLTMKNKATGATRVTCDPGRALATGLWADIGRFRAPPLRGLAARAPYFHDGQAKDLKQVIDHYNTRFNLSLGSQQKRDLEAFLKAL